MAVTKWGSIAVAGLFSLVAKVARNAIGLGMMIVAGGATIVGLNDAAKAIMKARDEYLTQGAMTDRLIIKAVGDSQTEKIAYEKKKLTQTEAALAVSLVKGEGAHQSEMLKHGVALKTEAEKTTGYTRQSALASAEAAVAMTALSTATKEYNTAYSKLNDSINESNRVILQGEELINQANIIHAEIIDVMKAEFQYKTEQALEGIADTADEKQALSDLWKTVATASPEVLSQMMQSNANQIATEQKIIAMLPNGGEKMQHQELLKELQTVSDNIQALLIISDEFELSMPEAPTHIPILHNQEEEQNSSEESRLHHS